ncbi:MerR family transcriptional regulator [Bradyrhizobium sp. UFLA03-84]|uniref:MerR family transcriptional regulator n=1 Tax=Bradyrhizobium sp. UFLA03-84 TaxID=418599 RepID=UPI000BAE6587|nr:helix-turn-helix domain-containing protein [Bradyrhizobium sp. UFLA03-84]PAY03867.1 MerR family transcriptional regulator [Bradyrhizobium sp. UFLA03-84]
MDALTIGQLGRATDTKIETIRYFEKIGLLPAPRRTAGNYRSYAAEHLQRLGFIRRTRDLGFTIEQVRELLKLAAHGEKPCEEVDQLVVRHLEVTERKIAALTRLRRELRETLDSCQGGRIAECRVIQALSPPTAARKKRVLGSRT